MSGVRWVIYLSWWVSADLVYLLKVALLLANKDIIVLRSPKTTPMPADAKNMRQKRQTPCRNIIPPLTDAISGRDNSSTVLDRT